MALVTAILLMFLGNVRVAVIVAINIPLALLFAFGVLFDAASRPICCRSAPSISASSSIRRSFMVEGIYRHLTRAGQAKYSWRNA